MNWRLAALLGPLLLLCANCAPDPCDGAAGACLLLRIVGDVGPLDSLEVRVSGAVSHQFQRDVMGQPPPLRLPLLFAPGRQGAVTVQATGRRGAEVAGAGEVQLALRADARQEAALRLAREPCAAPCAATPEPPALTAVQPARGPTTGGVPVRLLGTALPEGAEIRFGDAPATVTRRLPGGELEVTLPPRPAQAGPVEVTLRAAGTELVLRGAFTYYLGDLRFGQVTLPPAPGATARGVAVGEFSGDGRRDVIVAASNGTFGYVTLYPGDGVGGFAQARDPVGLGAPLESVTSADLDGDGNLDLAYCGGTLVQLLRFDGRGAIVERPILPMDQVGAGPGPIAARDLDGDALPDLLVGYSGETSLSLYRNQSKVAMLRFGGRESRPIDARSLTIATLLGPAGQRRNDLAIAGGGAEASLLPVDAQGALGARLAVQTGAATRALVAGDLDGDGWNDLIAVQTGAGQVSALLNARDAAAPFPSALAQRVGTSPRAAALLDLDGDGLLDLAVVDSVDAKLRVLRGQGAGTFAPGTEVVVGGTPSLLDAVDVDGDGREELLVVTGAAVVVLRNQSR